jgi:hypothetical protein
MPEASPCSGALILQNEPSDEEAGLYIPRVMVANSRQVADKISAAFLFNMVAGGGLF